jgi:hypothetical protein
MGSAVKMRTDYTSDELRRLAKRTKDVRQSRRLLSLAGAISRHAARGTHATLIMDRAGWHTTAGLKVPKTVTPIFLPSRAPELKLVENV